MTEVYLFDWGDTLMVDFPGVLGKMCDWGKVAAVTGAKEALASLSQHAKIYVATGAANSTEAEIEKAFERVGLHSFISGYFCKYHLGLEKGSPDFLNAILSKLEQPAENVAMVGDNFKKDIEPAIAVGIQAIWFSADKKDVPPAIPVNVKIIGSLSELYE